jgi:hypothetical protein
MRSSRAALCALGIWVAASGMALAQEGAAIAPPAAVAASQAKAPQPPRKAPAKPVPPAVVPAKRQPGRPRSLEVSLGAAWLGRGSLGAADANLTTNGSSTPTRYFSTSGDMAGAPAFDGRLTYNLSRTLAVEAGASYGKPKITFSVSGDFENAAGFTATGETMSQIFADANVLLYVPSLSFARGRGRTFVEAGAGYLRQLHEGNYDIETGKVYNGGAGLKYYFKPRPRGVVKAFGFRVDLRGYYKVGGFTFDKQNTWTLALAAGAIAAF